MALSIMICAVILNKKGPKHLVLLLTRTPDFVLSSLLLASVCPVSQIPVQPSTGYWRVSMPMTWSLPSQDSGGHAQVWENKKHFFPLGVSYCIPACPPIMSTEGWEEKTPLSHYNQVSLPGRKTLQLAHSSHDTHSFKPWVSQLQGNEYLLKRPIQHN